MFFFHSPQAKKPVGVQPLIGCEVRVPDGEEKTFDKAKIAGRDNVGGFEFEILSRNREPARYYVASPEERLE